MNLRDRARAQRRREAAWRVRGLAFYVWRTGVLGWALPTFALVTVVVRVAVPLVWPPYAPESPLWLSLAIGTVVWTLGGIGYGWVRWRSGAGRTVTG